MNVKELKDFCDKAIAEGHGDKEVYISRDDEGNGYHRLCYSFTPNVEEFDDNLSSENDIILG